MLTTTLSYKVEEKGIESIHLLSLVKVGGMVFLRDIVRENTSTNCRHLFARKDSGYCYH